MTKFAVLIVALALASGLQAAQIKPAGNTWTYFAGDGTYQQMPGGIEFIPEPVAAGGIEFLPEPVIPEYQPPVEEVAVPEVKPLPIVNPCEACFSYMSSLIEELTDTIEVQPHIPDGPHQIDPETEIRPLPPVEVPETKPVVSISYFPYFPAVVPN